MLTQNTFHLFDDYYLELSIRAEVIPFFEKHESAIFPDRADTNYKNIYSQEERNLMKELNKNLKDALQLYFFIKKGEEKIGWAIGKQISHDTYQMNNTSIFETYRNKGIYKKVLSTLLNILKEKGFQKVISYHHPVNNAVIVPKLKTGFIITGMQMHENFGTLVQLTYYFNETNKKLIDYRVGYAKSDDELKNILGI
ncbi:MAG: GNAT family N-acetyltransferase [Fimbriimonadaceae bacterium]|nr:GNAT family N-acetyltransferase [Chitinophagales bacterium]